MMHLDEAAVERTLADIDLVALMRATLRAAASGNGGGPTRASFTTPQGVWFGAMPAWVSGDLDKTADLGDADRNALGAKLVVAAPENAARGLPTHRAVVVLLDPMTGEPAAWIEAEALTRARTAAVSVVATEVLARVPRGAHAILGAGAQGGAHLGAFARAGMVERLAVWSRDRAHASVLAECARVLSIDCKVADDADDAVRGADVVTTCTASAEPLFDVASVADGVHVNAVGACVAHKRELPARLIGDASLVVDDVAAARAEAGDVILAVAEGAASWDGVVSLGDVLARRKTPRSGRCSVFVSLGLGVEDVAAAAALVRAAGV
ncbi:MAG: Ornithine cyclodeaminase [Candidatus Eremiobacteraeota bacterium]|nr:Ornithine cyclodeaminase [Candidatus Eremiobacteraeota bacterium]